MTVTKLKHTKENPRNPQRCPAINIKGKPDPTAKYLRELAAASNRRAQIQSYLNETSPEPGATK